jgi:ACS family allantoate permease-like MFS transporter
VWCRPKWHQVKEALLDLRTWIYFLVCICLNIPNGGLNGFYSIIIATFGFSTKQLTLMNIPTVSHCVTAGPVSPPRR